MAKKNDIRFIDKTVIDEVLTKRIAVLAMKYTTPTYIAKKLGISKDAVESIMETDKYKNVVAKAGDEEVSQALAKAKKDMSRLTPKAVKVIEKALDDAVTGAGSMREGLGGAQLVLKAAGIHETEEKAQDATINIVLPSGVTQEVTYEVKEEKESGAV